MVHARERLRAFLNAAQRLCEPPGRGRRDPDQSIPNSLRIRTDRRAHILCDIARRSQARVIAAEVTTAAPLSAAFEAGAPCPIDYQPSFVDGIGAKGLLEEMWPLVEELIDDAIATSPAQIAAAVRLLIERNRVVAEGAGAASLAAVRARDGLDEPIVCVISGGNIDATKLVAILSGRVPD